jgi:hypothetical protein
VRCRLLINSKFNVGGIYPQGGFSAEKRSRPPPGYPALGAVCAKNKVAGLGRTVEGTTSCRVNSYAPLLFLSGFEIAAPKLSSAAFPHCIPQITPNRVHEMRVHAPAELISC